MGGVLLAYQPAGEEGEPGLHEEYEVPCIESPAEIGSDPDVASSVGQLYRERLFSHLLLVFVEGLFLLGVVRVRLVGWLGHDERIPGRVDGVGLVTRSNAGGIRLGLVCGERDDRRAAQDTYKEDDDGYPEQHDLHQGRT